MKGPPDAHRHARHRTAVVAGGTGLVGQLLLQRLCTAPEYGAVIALARRPPSLVDPKLQVRSARFDALAGELADLAPAGAVHGGVTPLATQGSTTASGAAPGAQAAAAPVMTKVVEPPAVDVFCCLGTTLRAAGSEQAFRRVDHDYVLALGRWALQVQARRFVMLSALGADPASTVFYNRVKGEIELALAALGLPSLTVLRPSLLDGRRPKVRPAERLALLLSRPLRALIPVRLRPVRVGDVAATMLQMARHEAPPGMVLSADMHGAAGRRPA